jgi:hypothetical protein
MGYRTLLAVRPDEMLDTGIFTRFRRPGAFSDEVRSEDRCRPADVPRGPPAPVAPMGASRARDVNGSRCRPASAWFRSNDRSCSVRAVFGLPPRSDRDPRRADAVVIPTTLCSHQNLTVIASLGFKLHRQLRRQGGRGRPDGLAGSRTERGETMRGVSNRLSAGCSLTSNVMGDLPGSTFPCRPLEHLRPVGARAIGTDTAQLVSHRGAKSTRRTQRPQRSQARSFAGRDAGRRESCGDR